MIESRAFSYRLALMIAGYAIFPFHALGLFILSRNKGSLDKIQVVFLFNLCFVEAQLTFFKTLEIMFSLLRRQTAERYVSIYVNIGCCFPYYFVMVLYTLNRFSELYLNLRYTTYWTAKVVKRSIITVWGLAACASVCLMISSVTIEDIYRVSYKYILPSLNTTATLFISSTYIYISYKCYQFFKMNKIIKTQLRQNTITGNLSYVGRHRRSKKILRYLMPTIFIFTFLVFIIIPDSIYSYKYLSKGIIEESFKMFVGLSYFIGFVTDAFIYIFLSPGIRNNLFKKMTTKKKQLGGTIISTVTRDARLTNNEMKFSI